MNGRNIFQKYKNLFKILEFLMKIIPKPLFLLVWNLSSFSEGKIALLIRYLYIKKYARKCGINIFIGKYVVLKNESNIIFGDNISIHAFCYIDGYGGIDINNNVSISNHCSIISFNHTYLDESTEIKYNPVVKGEIIFQEDVWIGSGARILPNVTIGKRSIVAAGAVVQKNVSTKVIVGGVPAKILKGI